MEDKRLFKSTRKEKKIVVILALVLVGWFLLRCTNLFG